MTRNRYEESAESTAEVTREEHVIPCDHTCPVAEASRDTISDVPVCVGVPTDELLYARENAVPEQLVPPGHICTQNATLTDVAVVKLGN